MTIYETDVPGVGKRYEIDGRGERRTVVIVHHDGRREIYDRPHPDQDGQKLLDLNDRQARQLATALQGAEFQPVGLDNVEVPLGDAIIEWVEITPEKDAIGRTLGDLRIRHHTGATVIAVQRGEETLVSPDPDTALEADDVLIAIGSRAEQRELAQLLETGPADED